MELELEVGPGALVHAQRAKLAVAAVGQHLTRVPGGRTHHEVDLAPVDGAHGTVAHLLPARGGPQAAEVVCGHGACGVSIAESGREINVYGARVAGQVNLGSDR